MASATKSSPVLNANQINLADRAVSGTVRRLTFRSEENGYFVARLAVEGVKDEISVVGYAAEINEGQRLEAEGRWELSKYGRQFKATSVKVSLPLTEAGLIKYLAGILTGVGPIYAEKLVKTFGSKVLDVIADSPERLADVPGMGKKRIKAVIDAWEAREGQRGENALPWLCGLGLSMSYAKRIAERYGARTRKTVSENPYVLAEVVRGIGFLRADALARKLGISASNPNRIRAAFKHVLQAATDMGSCGLPREHLINGRFRRNGSKAAFGARDWLGFDESREHTALLEEQLSHLVAKGEFVEAPSRGVSCLFLRSIFNAEKEIAHGLRARLREPQDAPDDLLSQIQAAERELKIVLENTQRAAVATALSESVSILTGGPGTGKTTITRVIVSMLEARGLRVTVCAPTGKAAKRASETIGVPAATIHRTLEWRQNGPQFNEQRRLECDALVLDEVSMVDVELFHKLLAALPEDAKLILVGDADQLPSVGPGKVLTDLIACERVPTTRLTEVFRQAQKSLIIRNAHDVNRGQPPSTGHEEGTDFGFLHFESPDETQAALLAAARDIYKRKYHPIRDVQVLTPMRKGPLGVDTLNGALQRLLNPMPSAKMPFQGGHLGVDDKVIQIRNNYAKEVFNGEVGFVLEVDPAQGSAVIDFDGHAIEYAAHELEELRLAYAFTIHRAQGSEFPVVLMALHKSHFVMLKRNLLYTGITRARELMLIFGHIQSASIAARQCQIEQRHSKLRDWLVEPEIAAPELTAAVG